MCCEVRELGGFAHECCTTNVVSVLVYILKRSQCNINHYVLLNRIVQILLYVHCREHD